MCVQLFCDAKREEIKAANPGASFGETGKFLAAAWKGTALLKTRPGSRSRVRCAQPYVSAPSKKLHAIIVCAVSAVSCLYYALVSKQVSDLAGGTGSHDLWLSISPY